VRSAVAGEWLAVGSYQGRLELTWTNKPLRLLAHEDGRYEWVSPSDYRVAEVRLLDDLTTVGEVNRARAGDNLLIRGDALNALRSLARLPEFAHEYLGRVKLAYLDPPFNTQQSFLHYDDALEHSVWLTMMRDRLLQIRDLLSPDGSVWVHLDDSEVHRARCVLDEVFGLGNFVATVIWEKADSPRNSARQLSTDHDYIVIYSREPEWSPQRLPRTDAANSIYSNRDGDPRGPWLPGDPYANKPYSRGLYEVIGPSGRTFKPPPGRFWRVSEERLRELDADGRVWWGPKGAARPSIKRYLEEVADLVPRTLWTRDEVGSNRTSKNELRALFPGAPSFATPKPEALMHRILQIGTAPGDIVLDCFVGSGTTAAVAHKMSRRWVAVEREASSIATYAVPRLSKVVGGEDAGGVTEVTDWKGGGGFRLLNVAPSMFEADTGLVFLGDWMTNGKLAEATAAQLGYAYEVVPPFSGRKGRTRLAVIDGVVNEAVVRIIVSALGHGERVVVCGTGIDTDARPVLRELRPGSTLRKIPAALLDEYRSSRQLRLDMAQVGAPVEATDGQTAAVEVTA
jgi:adenine-specific DNA-methyltransferase